MNYEIFILSKDYFITINISMNLKNVNLPELLIYSMKLMI